MKDCFKVAIAIAFIVATSAAVAQQGQAQQIGDNFGSAVSSEADTPVYASASKKKRSSTKALRALCNSFGGHGWVCRPAGKRTCCCDHSFLGRDCFSLE